MRSDLLQMAADLAQREEPFVLAVVVREAQRVLAEGKPRLVLARGTICRC